MRGFLVLSLGLVLVAGCQEDNSSSDQAAAAEALAAQYGEPIGLKIPPKGDLPGYTIALALSRGAAVESLIEPITAALHGAVSACPALLSELSLGRDSVLSFSITEARVNATLGKDASAGEQCLVKALNGASLKIPPGMTLDAIARFIYGTGDSGPSKTP